MYSIVLWAGALVRVLRPSKPLILRLIHNFQNSSRFCFCSAGCRTCESLVFPRNRPWYHGYSIGRPPFP